MPWQDANEQPLYRFARVCRIFYFFIHILLSLSLMFSECSDQTDTPQDTITFVLTVCQDGKPVDVMHLGLQNVYLFICTGGEHPLPLPYSLASVQDLARNLLPQPFFYNATAKFNRVCPYVRTSVKVQNHQIHVSLAFADNMHSRAARVATIRFAAMVATPFLYGMQVHAISYEAQDLMLVTKYVAKTPADLIPILHKCGWLIHPEDAQTNAEKVQRQESVKRQLQAPKVSLVFSCPNAAVISVPDPSNTLWWNTTHPHFPVFCPVKVKEKFNLFVFFFWF